MDRDLAAWLREKFPQAKQTTLRQMLSDGRVRVNGILARKMKQPLSATDRVEVIPLKSNRPEPVSLNPLKLLFEDADLIVVEKPAGLLTSTVAAEKRQTALALLRRYCHHRESNTRIGVIHRLDRDASGLLVFSKNEETYTALKRQFFHHDVQRVYLAITESAPSPPTGRVENLLVELPDGTIRESHRPGSGERAVSEYATLHKTKGLAVVAIKLQTGRKHQIRVHLKQRGAPILGDKVYNPSGQPAPRMMLAALVLGFVHPRTGKSMRFESAAPKEFPLVGRQNITLPPSWVSPEAPL